MSTPARRAAGKGRERTVTVRHILGLDVAALTHGDAIDHIRTAIAERRKTLVAFANTNLVLSSRRRDLNTCFNRDPRWLILNDGVGMDIASKVLFGRSFPANLNGTDFTPALLKSLPANTRVFLFGARPASVAGAADRIAKLSDVTICGYHEGHQTDDAAVLAEINAANPDLLLVALGNPRQEAWAMNHADQCQAPVIMGVGALFDFLSETVQRAPLWVRRLRLEWVYRLLQEPRRLAKRYTWDLAVFLTLVLRQRLATPASMRKAP